VIGPIGEFGRRSVAWVTLDIASMYYARDLCTMSVSEEADLQYLDVRSLTSYHFGDDDQSKLEEVGRVQFL
jgi:hypothetical protein